MSRNMWILAVLISVLVIASIYSEQSGMKMPDHLNCKESMFEQMFTDKCTPCLLYTSPSPRDRG